MLDEAFVGRMERVLLEAGWTDRRVFWFWTLWRDPVTKREYGVAEAFDVEMQHRMNNLLDTVRAQTTQTKKELDKP